MRWYSLALNALIFCLLFQMTPVKIVSADSSGHKVTVTLHSGGKTVAVRTYNSLAPDGTADTNIDFGGGKSMTSNTSIKNSQISAIDTGSTNGDTELYRVSIVAFSLDNNSTLSVRTKTDYNSASLDADVQHANFYDAEARRPWENHQNGYYSAIAINPFSFSYSPGADNSTLSVHAEATYNQPRTYIHGTGYTAYEVDVNAGAPGTDEHDTTCNNYFEATGEAKNNPAPWAHAVSIPSCGVATVPPLPFGLVD
jgi:hypothetical protein